MYNNDVLLRSTTDNAMPLFWHTEHGNKQTGTETSVHKPPADLTIGSCKVDG
jgi:hypothetical protein